MNDVCDSLGVPDFGVLLKPGKTLELEDVVAEILAEDMV